MVMAHGIEHPNCRRAFAALPSDYEGPLDRGERPSGGGGGGSGGGRPPGGGSGNDEDPEYIDIRTAIVPEAKMIYSLSDPNKGRVFKSFGFDPSRPGQLRRAILAGVEGVTLVPRGRNEFGHSYSTDFDIVTPDGRTVPLKVGWFRRNGEDFLREVTAYIDLRELRRRERKEVK